MFHLARLFWVGYFSRDDEDTEDLDLLIQITRKAILHMWGDDMNSRVAINWRDSMYPFVKGAWL